MQKLTSCEIINENFFFIDSNNLDQVQSKMYGYYIDGDQIIDSKNESNFTKDYSDILDGSFILIQRVGDQIEIRTDYCGTQKIFLFRNGNYFALSNSFILLVDQIKTKFSITLNEDYAYHLMTIGLSTLTLTSTMINEIELIPRNFKVIIKTIESKVKLERLNYHEYFLNIDSAEGVNVLDNWFKHWLNIIRKLYDTNQAIKIDVSGGKDSRIALSAFLRAGINLDKILFRSTNDGLWVHDEDYKIASEIAEYYNFLLNDKPFEISYKNFSFEEIINISFYSKLGFNANMHYRTKGYSSNTIYRFTGFGAETMRGHWPDPPIKWIEREKRKSQNYRSINFESNIQNILSQQFNKIDEIFDLYNFDSYPLPMSRVHQETRNRHHFGGIMLEHYLANTITLSPMMDYAIHQFKVPCINESYDFLIVFILERYCDQLLKFRLEGARIFDSEVINYAKEINNKFPLDKNFVDLKSSVGTAKNKIDIRENHNSAHEIEQYLLNLTQTDKFKNLFTENAP